MNPRALPCAALLLWPALTPLAPPAPRAYADTSELSVGVAGRADLAPASTPRDPLGASDLERLGGELRVALGLTQTLWLYSRFAAWGASGRADAPSLSSCPFGDTCATPRLQLDASAQRATLGLALQPLDDLSPALWGGLGVERVDLARGEVVWVAQGEAWRGVGPRASGVRWGAVVAAGAGVEWRCASRVSVGAGAELAARVSPWEPSAPSPLWVSALAWVSWSRYVPLF